MSNGIPSDFKEKLHTELLFAAMKDVFVLSRDELNYLLSETNCNKTRSVVDELLTNIQRACVRGRNGADLSKEHDSFIASFDHIEDLAAQAKRQLN